MSFELDYKKILKYAENLTSKYPFMFSGDVINSAYIKLVESGEIYSFDTIKKKINEACSDEALLNSGTRNMGQIVGAEEKSKQCKICNEVFPIDNFYSFTKKNGQIIKAVYCKSCDNKKSGKYQKSARFNKQKVRDRLKRGRKELAAWYVVKALTDKGISRRDITRQMILNKRQQIINSRESGYTKE